MGTVVGQLEALDADYMGRRILSQRFQYKLIQGEGSQDNSYFLIEGNQLVIAKILD